MRKLKIVLTLGVLLFLSAPLFARDGKITLYLKTLSFDTRDVIYTLVEYRTVYDPMWVRCLKIPAFYSVIDVNNLIDGKEYQFRVTLISNYGSGEPSNATEFIKIDPVYPQEIEIQCRPARQMRSNYVMVESNENALMDMSASEQEPRIPFRR